MDRFGDNRRSGGGGFNRGFQRNFSTEKHKATCSECNKECEVPFKPREGRPVYCNDCWQKHKKF